MFERRLMSPLVAQPEFPLNRNFETSQAFFMPERLGSSSPYLEGDEWRASRRDNSDSISFQGVKMVKMIGSVCASLAIAVLGMSACSWAHATDASTGGTEVRQKCVRAARKLRDEPDYGQFILQAISNQSAREAKEAADYLSRCSVAKKLHEALEKSRGGTQLSNAKLGKLIEGAEDLQRKCQSVSEDMAAHGEELALRALQGGIPGAGVAYGERVNYSPPEAMKVPLREALRLDAMAGSEVAVQRLALYGNKLGLTSYEQTAYYAVAMELGSQHQAEMLQRVVEARNPPALSAQEKVEADRIAQRLRAKLAAKPRGMSDS
ncbi:hypothetical protein PV762_24710 [Mitsuaria sp. CC2]|uniref:hypothetical protein n=1 Tax=Mitsuaria sp. CC2 TaxID=3029186 RepID=UPI003B8D892C